MTLETHRLQTLSGWKFYCCQRRNFPHLLICSKLIPKLGKQFGLAALP